MAYQVFTGGRILGGIQAPEKTSGQAFTEGATASMNRRITKGNLADQDSLRRLREAEEARLVADRLALERYNAGGLQDATPSFAPKPTLGGNTGPGLKTGTTPPPKGQPIPPRPNLTFGDLDAPADPYGIGAWEEERAAASPPTEMMLGGGGDTDLSGSAGGDVIANWPQTLITTESSGRWDASNNAVGAGGVKGHYGRLQFGVARLSEAKAAGVMPKGMTPQQFLRRPDIQMLVEQWHFDDINRYIVDRGLDQFIGQTIDGATVTLPGMQAVAHLGGKNGLRKFLTSGGKYNPDDGETKLSDYLSIHGGGGTDLKTAVQSIGIDAEGYGMGQVDPRLSRAAGLFTPNQLALAASDGTFAVQGGEGEDRLGTDITSQRVADAARTGGAVRGAIGGVLDRGLGYASAAGSALYGAAADAAGLATSVVPGLEGLAGGLEGASDTAYNVARENFANGYSATQGRPTSDFNMNPADFTVGGAAPAQAPADAAAPAGAPPTQAPVIRMPGGEELRLDMGAEAANNGAIGAPVGATPNLSFSQPAAGVTPQGSPLGDLATAARTGGLPSEAVARAYLLQPAQLAIDKQRVAAARSTLEEQARYARASRNGDLMAQTRAAAIQLNAQGVYLDGMQAIVDFGMGDPSGLNGAFNAMSGGQVTLQPLDNGTFNVISNNQETGNMTRDEVINAARLAFDQTYQQQVQASIAGDAARGEAFYEAQLESMVNTQTEEAKGNAALRLELIKGQLKAQEEQLKAEKGPDADYAAFNTPDGQTILYDKASGKVVGAVQVTGQYLGAEALLNNDGSPIMAATINGFPTNAIK